MTSKQEQALPVLHPVTDYEKIKRVGEGTYGVVCTYHSLRAEDLNQAGSALSALTCLMLCRQGKRQKKRRDSGLKEAQDG